MPKVTHLGWSNVEIHYFNTFEIFWSDSQALEEPQEPEEVQPEQEPQEEQQDSWTHYIPTTSWADPEDYPDDVCPAPSEPGVTIIWRSSMSRSSHQDWIQPPPSSPPPDH